MGYCAAFFLCALSGCGGPPKFGSTPELSTMEGFVVGRWRMVFDDSAAKVKMPKLLSGALDHMVNIELTFRNDGRFEVAEPFDVGRGTWRVKDGLVYLTLETVNGTPIDKLGGHNQQMVAGWDMYSPIALNKDKVRLYRFRETETSDTKLVNWVRG